ncbi:DUF397 domain-containing protein [Actinomadura rudentiformis]|uniref:DUF397 domain-containing protein n=1 Tax=Actinomadura rudentiformis TaxID=359158 RepID=A0A6H9YK46_9ACTN|nr:DUF397 domain-containing protein [Actinomadura rudentiformis]KAB2343247.1 DUF397 domain-containing protein [Actinomadura rudentiformis]
MDLSGARWRKSSRSADNGGECVELALIWRKSSRSGDNGGECVELASQPGVVAVRDSKDSDGGVLLLPRDTFRRLTDRIKEG